MGWQFPSGASFGCETFMSQVQSKKTLMPSEPLGCFRPVVSREKVTVPSRFLAQARIFDVGGENNSHIPCLLPEQELLLVDASTEAVARFLAYAYAPSRQLASNTTGIQHPYPLHVSAWQDLALFVEQDLGENNAGSCWGDQDKLVAHFVEHRQALLPLEVRWERALLSLPGTWRPSCSCCNRHPHQSSNVPAMCATVGGKQR